MFDKNNYAPRWARLGVQLSHISPVNYVGVGKISHFPALPSLLHPSLPLLVRRPVLIPSCPKAIPYWYLSLFRNHPS